MNLTSIGRTSLGKCGSSFDRVCQIFRVEKRDVGGAAAVLGRMGPGETTHVDRLSRSRARLRPPPGPSANVVLLRVLRVGELGGRLLSPIHRRRGPVSSM